MPDQVTLRRPLRVRGEVRVPGDKSISHRALLLGAMAQGRSRLVGRAAGRDQDSMVTCLRALGIEISDRDDVTFVRGVGLRGLASPAGELDCGNSGATLRFLTGAVAGVEAVEARLVGDESLSRRPMARVAEPLRRMGAEIEIAPEGTPPVTVRGRQLRGADLVLDVPSAQVKTAVLLAALNADGPTTVREPSLSRDHTERLLRRLGVNIDIGAEIRVQPPPSLPAFELTIPGDPSAAAFWAVLATCHPDAELTIRNVCLNPTRAGFLAVLGRMGASILVTDVNDTGGEAAADLVVKSSNLSGTEIAPDEVPSLLDEIPVLAVAAAMASSESNFRGLAELRVKEVDRLSAIERQLNRMGASVVVEGDDVKIGGGGTLEHAHLASGGDHRMAMALAVAASIAHGETNLSGPEAADISYPGFWAELARLTSIE